ncbi:MFS transporter [Actinoplanes sp. NPDC026623]|uniref:MFS transporter n=1 Tax=Actinoplanes sp. NPDC026623 TaxID=3155610 RepID=UPI003406E64F
MTATDLGGRAGLGRRFRVLWASAAASNLGDGVRTVAMPLAVASVTREPRAVALAVASTRIAWLAAPVFGAMIDRMDRRRVMLVADSARALVVVCLAVALAMDLASLPLLLAAGLLLGVGEVFFDTAAQTMVPSVVADENLERANSRLFATTTVTNQFLGQPLGGWLAGIALAAPFGVDAVALVVSILLVLTVRGRFRPELPAELAQASLWVGLRTALLWCLRDPLIRVLILAVTVFGLMEGVLSGTLVLFALEELGLSTAGFGLLLTMAATGSVAGAVLAPRISRRIGPKAALLLSTGIAGGSYVLLGLSGSLWLAGVWLAINSAMTLLWNVVTVAARQRVIPDHLLGAVTAVYRMAAWGALPVGTVIGGVIADGFGLRAPAVIAGVGIALTSVLVAAIPRRRLAEATQARPDQA